MTGRPKRVLHAVRLMNRGGVETWLMHVLRHMDGRRVRMDFLVHSEQPGEYDEEIGKLGARLIRCPQPLWSPAYRRRIGAVLRHNGPYDVFHSHVHHFSGYLLDLAHRSGIPVRIAHSHNDTSGIDQSAGWARRSYLRWANACILNNATSLTGVSRPAARALFGAAWQADSRSRLLRCGIDLAPFRLDVDRHRERANWRIGEGDFVIGHVGRFEVQKNHAFLVRVAAEVMRRRADAKLLLVGDGSLRASIEQAVREAGIAGRIIFTGPRSDVPRLLRSMDVLLFPSLWEGLPLTAVEAQAAGLPCVISDVISQEADIVAELIRRVPLAWEPSRWAETVIATREGPKVAPAEALRRVEQSSFSISSSIEQLYALYDA